MKKFAAIAVAAVIASGLTTTAFADNVNSYRSKAGITPDSILYPVDKAIDNLKITITFGNENKSKVLVEIAEERLGESQVMSDENKTGLMKEAIEDYNNKMSEACDKIQTASTDAKVNNDENKSEELSKTAETINLKQEKSIEVLKALESKVSDSAKSTIENVIKMQTAKKEAVANMVEKRHELNAARKAYHAAEVELKKVTKTGDAAAIKTAADTCNALKDKYTTAQQALIDAARAKQAAVKGVKDTVDAAKDAIKAEVKSGTITKEDIKNAAKPVKKVINNKGTAIKNLVKEEKQKINAIKKEYKEKKQEIVNSKKTAK